MSVASARVSNFALLVSFQTCIALQGVLKPRDALEQFSVCTSIRHRLPENSSFGKFLYSRQLLPFSHNQIQEQMTDSQASACVK